MYSPFDNTSEWTDPDEEDTKYFELRNYLSAYLNGNPNIIESLWVDEKDIVFKHKIYDQIRDHRKTLLVNNVSDSFAGYAYQQLKRIKGHNKWLNNPQKKEPPQQIDYVKMVQNFQEEKLFKRDFDIKDYKNNHRLIPYGNNIFGLVEEENRTVFNDIGMLNTKNKEHKNQLPKMIILFRREDYEKDKVIHKNYWKWKKERNPKRSILEEKYGYDTKHAMHLIRLLRMAKEIMETGEVLIKRPDAKNLLFIRDGGYSYEQILKESEDLNNEIKKLKDKSPLKSKSQEHEKLIEDLSINMYKDFFQKKNKPKTKKKL